MNTSTNLKILNKTIKLIKDNLMIFNHFEDIYIFGSILSIDRYPNDIDILLLYSTYSVELPVEANNICILLDEFSDYPIDLTVLSFEEEKNIGFLNKLNSLYKRVK